MREEYVLLSLITGEIYIGKPLYATNIIPPGTSLDDIPSIYLKSNGPCMAYLIYSDIVNYLIKPEWVKISFINLGQL